MNKQELLQLISTAPDFTRFEVEGKALVEEVFASSEQIIAVSTFSDVESLTGYWEHTAQELAVQVQSRLSGDYDAFRWDIYLIYLIEGPAIPLELKVRIENDRHFFRKIVIETTKSNDDRKVPISIQGFGDVHKGGEYLFHSHDFLDQLGGCVQNETRELIRSFFDADHIMNTQELTEFIAGIKV